MSADSVNENSNLFSEWPGFEILHHKAKDLIGIVKTTPIPGQLVIHISEIKVLQAILQHEAASLLPDQTHQSKPSVGDRSQAQ
jgi:hypothetical protein